MLFVNRKHKFNDVSGWFLLRFDKVGSLSAKKIMYAKPVEKNGRLLLFILMLIFFEDATRV